MINRCQRIERVLEEDGTVKEERQTYTKKLFGMTILKAITFLKQDFDEPKQNKTFGFQNKPYE